MKSVADVKKQQLLDHQRELKRLNSKNQLELERLKNQHEKVKSEIRLSQKQQKHVLHNDHQRAMAAQAQRNEEAYSKLRDSLEMVKTKTQSDKAKIEKTHSQDLQKLRVNYENLARSKKEKNDYLMQDIDHQARTEINKMQRRIKAKEAELKKTQTEQLQDVKMQGEKLREVTHSEYDRKHNAQSLKFQTALLNQKKGQVKQLATNEQNHHKVLDTRKKVYTKETHALESNHLKKKDQMNKMHEKTYAENFKKNEFVLKKLLGRKEAILNHLKGNLKKEYAKEIVLDKDPFYQHTTLNPTVEINKDKNGYIVQMPVGEHEMKSVKLTGYDREIKISMDRNFDFNKTKKTGAKETIKRVESFTTKIPVSYLLDSKSITKSYQDGILRFDIKFA